MCKKLKKLCAWALAVVTVFSVIPSSGFVMADTTGNEASESEVEQGTVYFKVPNADGQIVVSTQEDGSDKQTITVTDEKTTLTDKDGNVSDVALTEEGYCLELTEEVGTTIHTEVIASDGYEVGTYHILSDTGDEVENKSLSSDNKYDVTVSSDVQVVEVVFNAIPEETVEPEEVVTPDEETSEVVEEETEVSEETTNEETSEETTPESEEETVTPDNTETEETLEDSKEGSSYVGVSEEEQAEYEEGLIPEIEPNYTKTYSASDSNSISTFSADNSISPRYGDTTVEEYGSVTLADASGLSREGLLWWLGSHVSDNYYLSTPYNPGWIPNSGMSADYRNPNGDCEGAYGVADKPGVPGMNCTGFVWHALTMAGGSNIPALSGWVTYLRTHDVQYRTYTGSNTTDILNTLLYEDDYLEVGDVIWMWDANAGDMRNGLSYAVSNSHHVGIYIGSYFDESNPYNEAPGWFHKNNGDKNGLWHSTDHTPAGYTAGNMISNITPKTDCYAITVVKTGAPTPPTPPTPPAPAQGDVTLKKSTGNSSLTSGNANYSYAGAQYGVYSDSGLNNRVGILTTDEWGNSNTLTLDAGTYYVKEITAPKGYMLDTTTHTVTVEAGQTATVTSNEPPISVTVNLTKQSDNPNVTSNNDLYSLKGAEYSIYRDANCTQYVTKITTDENGNGTVTGLPLNTYYMKETKASQGFGKDTKVYTIDASTGTTAVVTKSITSTEPCLMDPVGLLLQKVDAETGTKTPVDEGTLRDAQFEVKLYDTVMTTDPGASGHRPVWSAVMRTNEYGAIQLDNSYRVSGDLVMTDSSGRPALPYGTITFKEIKSPSGYLLNSTVIVQQIIGNNGSLATVPQYPDNGVTQKEQPMTLKIIKVQNGTTLRIPNAQFKWTLPDGSTHTYTTNSNGEVYFKGLEWGKHTIEEVKVPDGYSVNKNKITFTVNQDNTITGASGATVSDTDGNFTLVIDNNNLNPTVTYENKPAPFDLHVYKINDVDFALEGAEFTIYTDAACKNVWKKATTDSSGNLTFTDLIVGKTYYMKETKAPQGYRIPINDDGSDIVYKIKVTSTPVKNEFTFYVNDKAYTTASTGNYKVSGTKADRVCDMTIINERGKRLPETGSNMMLVLVIAGAALMGGALVVSRRKKDK